MTGAEVALAAAAAPEILGATAAGTAAAGTGAALGGMTAAGLGSAGLAAGEMAGLGAAGMGGGTAALFGAGAPALASSMMPATAAAAPVAGMGGGTAALFGAGTSGASPLAIDMATMGPAATSSGFPWARMATQMGKGMLQQDQQQPAPAQRPPQAGAPQSNAEILKRLQMMQGPRSNFGGLLAQAMGR